MSIWGKLAGASTGFVLGGPLGALLGGLAGHLYDRMQAGREGGAPQVEDRRELRELAFAAGLVALAAKLAKADGVVTRDEIAAFRQAFAITPEEARTIAKLYNEAKRSPHGFEAYAQQLAEVLDHDPALLEELLDGLFAVAAVDGRLHEAEERYLREVARIFGFTPWEFEAIRARWRASLHPAADEEPDPYEVLGVSREASDEEIKRAWRRLVREHHPDRLVAQGMPEEMVKQANDRLAAINAAYEKIARERGFG